MAFWAAAAPALISAAGSIGGGLLARGGGGDGGLSNQNSLWLAQQNLAFQSAAAQHGIKWRVDDAKDAGVHPLVALGAPTFNPSPVSANFDPGPQGGGHDWGRTLGNLGQDVGRAIFSTKTPQERVQTEFELKRQAQQLQQGDLQNQLLASQIARMNQPDQVGPSGPQIGRTGLMDGQPNSGPAGAGGASNTALGGWDNKRPDVSTHVPGDKSQISGPAVAERKWVNDGNGFYAIPNPDVKAEDEFGAPVMARFLASNWLAPNLTMRGAPSMSVVREHYPDATGVYFDHSSQKWKPTFNNERSWYDRYTSYRNSIPSRFDNWTRGRGFIP